MRAAVITEFGDSKTLKLTEVPTPQPTADEVQVKIAYAAVNPVDWKIREGILKGRMPHQFPLILGWDASGVVTAVGKNVTNLKVGDEVYGYFRKPVAQWGTYAEYVCFEAQHVALKPKKLTFAQAAAIPLTGLTAWQSLFDSAKFRKGESVLIHAGSGGVGGLAIQFARNAGAKKIFTTASRPNHDYVKKLGADVAIDYRQESFVDRVKSVIPDGIDVVFDCIGGETLNASYNVLKPGGRLVGIVQPPDPEAGKQHQVTVSYVFVNPNGAQLKQIANLIDEGKIIAPEIEEMSLEQVALAHEKSQTGHTRGKIVLKVAK